MSTFVQRRPGLWPTLAAVVVIVATLALGRWQVHRAAEKVALQAVLEARRQLPPVDLTALAVARVDSVQAAGLRFRPAVAVGRYVASGQIFIDNRDHDGTPGFHVLTPLLFEAGILEAGQLQAGSPGARLVLVNRGFVARDRRYPQAPEVPVPEGIQHVSGQLALADSRYVELSAQVVSGSVWQNLQLSRYAEVSHLNPLPLVLLAAPASAGLLAVDEHPDTNVDMHRGYAFQWFSLAATTFGLYLYFAFFRKARPLP